MSHLFSSIRIGVLLLVLSLPLLTFSKGKEDESKFCFRDLNSYQNSREKLPDFLKNMPLNLGTADGGVWPIEVLAVLNFSFTESGVPLLKSNYWKQGNHYKDEVEVAEICVSPKNQSIQVVMRNGVTETISYSKNRISISSIGLYLLSDVQIDEIRLKIDGKAGGKTPIRTGPATGNEEKVNQ